MIRLSQWSLLCSLFMVLTGCIFGEHFCRNTIFGTFCLPTRAPIDEGDFEDLFADPALNRETVILRLGEPDLVLQNGTAFLYYWRMNPGFSGPPIPGSFAWHRRYALLFVFDEQGLLERREKKEEWFSTSWKETEDWVQSVLPIPNQSDG